MSYSVGFSEEAQALLLGLDKSVRLKISKKLAQLERDDFKARHLKHGLPFFVEGVGGYRIAFFSDEKKKERHVQFVGTHKEYEKWFRAI